MDAPVPVWGMRRYLALYELEGLLGVYAKHLTREDARKHVEYTERFGLAELDWFDLRWPAEP